MTRGVVCALTGGVLWGFSGTCTQFLVNVYAMPAAYIAWVRMTVAGLMLIAIMLVRDREKLVAMIRDRRTVVQLVVYAIAGIALGQYAYTSCTRYTDAGTATMLQCVGIVMLMSVTCIHGRKMPERNELIAATMALVATFLIATQGDITSLTLPLAALIWGLLNAASNAFFAGYPGRLLDRWGSLAVMGCGMLIGSIAILPMAQPWNVQLQLDIMSIGALFSVSVLGSFLSFTLFLEGVKYLGGVKASLLGVSEPVSATIFSWALMSATFTVFDLIGFAMMIAMVVLVTARKPETQSGASSADDSPKPAREAELRAVPASQSIS